MLTSFRDSKDKFDVTVDKRASAFVVEARTYVRDFVGSLPRDQNTGKPVQVALGVVNTWYSIPLPKGSREILIARCVIDSGVQIDTVPIQVDAGDVMNMKIRTFLRQPQNHDWLLSWEEEDPKRKARGRRGGNGGGNGGSGGGSGGSGPGDSDDDDSDDNDARKVSGGGRKRRRDKRSSLTADDEV